jgi:hypothetical protein
MLTHFPTSLIKGTFSTAGRIFDIHASPGNQTPGRRWSSNLRIFLSICCRLSVDGFFNIHRSEIPASNPESAEKDRLLLQGLRRGNFNAGEAPHSLTSFFWFDQEKKGDAEMKD